MIRDINDLKLTFLIPDHDGAIEVPYYDNGVAAGFPSPADDWKETKISLDREVCGNKSSTTFYVRVSGHSMTGAGISDNDVVVVDKSLTPETGDICVCILDGEFTLKRLRVEPECVWLIPENDDFPPILIEDNSRFQVWGVVTHALHSYKKK